MTRTLLIFAYLPPQGSTFYNQFNNTNGIEFTRGGNAKCNSTNKDFHIVLCGDINARCGKLSDYIVDDGLTPVDDNDDDWYDIDTFNQMRQSKDTGKQCFGENFGRAVLSEILIF